MGDDRDVGMLLGGVGGVYLLATPGELVIEVEKRDRNERDRHTELRAVLVGPDRGVVQEVTIPDDGRPVGSGLGPPQRVRLTTHVERGGIYALNVTVSQDRYGEDALWGFSTNCPRYLIETSRGHRDARHEEPIVLYCSGGSGDVCFAPRAGAFGLEVGGLPEGVEALELFDAEGGLIENIEVDEDGCAAHVFAEERERVSGVWRLHLPVQQATVQIDGVTRWERGELHEDLSLWTDDADAHFPLAQYRWMLTPYSRTVYAPAESDGEFGFQVHNNGAETRVFELSLEFPGEEWPARLSTERVEVGAGEVESVSVAYTAGPENAARACHVRIAPQADPEVTTYSTLWVKSGAAPVSRALDMPLLLAPYRHENEQFGYRPDYPLATEVYFDLGNRPFTWAGKALYTRREGKWIAVDPVEKARQGSTIPSGRVHMACSKVAFDRGGGLYAVAAVDGRDAVLYSADGGVSFAACPLGDEDGPRGAYDIEQFSGHNLVDGPPPVLHSVQTEADERLIWRRVCTLDLLLPEERSGGLVAGEPIRVSDQSLGVGSHSGIPSAVVSHGSRVHVIWAEATDPDEDVPGVPTYVVTYDRDAGRLGEPALIGYGAPANDVHNRPSLVVDSRGFLHALAGTHGAPFQYARSLRPNDAGGGWTEAESVGDRQTYIGLVCGPDDTLHLVYRMWRHNREPHPASYHASLAYQRKRPGEPWSPPRVLVAAPFSEYSIFYHKLTVDRRGRLFLSYDYWSTYWFYRMDRRGCRRSLMMSADAGDAWKLVESDDFD